MKHAVLRVVGGVGFAALAALAIGGPAYGDVARTDVTDLKVAVDAAHGKVGDTIKVHAATWNLGPSIAVEGTVTFRFVAPGGTELTDDFASVPTCHVVTSGHEVWCTNGGQLWPPEYVNNGALLDYGWDIHLKIVSPEVSPGQFEVTYANGDTDTSNNSAPIVVTVDGVTTSPTASASPSVSPSPTASANPSASASPSVGVSPSARVSVSAAPARLPTTGARTGLLAAVGGLLVVLGAAAVLVSRRRRA